MSDHNQRIAKLMERPIYVVGATAEEMVTIRSALRLLRTRAAEKHTEHPNMGWGKQAQEAEEIEIRITL